MRTSEILVEIKCSGLNRNKCKMTMAVFSLAVERLRLLPNPHISNFTHHQKNDGTVLLYTDENCISITEGERLTKAVHVHTVNNQLMLANSGSSLCVCKTVSVQLLVSRIVWKPAVLKYSFY